MNVLALLLALNQTPSPTTYDSYMMPGTDSVPCEGYFEGDETPAQYKCRAIANLHLAMRNALCEMDFPPGQDRDACYLAACQEWYIAWNDCYSNPNLESDQEGTGPGLHRCRSLGHEDSESIETFVCRLRLNLQLYEDQLACIDGGGTIKQINDCLRKVCEQYQQAWENCGAE